MRIPFLAALLLSAVLFSVAAVPAPTLCQVRAQATPGRLPGIYTVVITTSTTLQGRPCPAHGYAYVRLESGRVYPYRHVQPGRPVVYQGIPWYWRGVWRAASGTRYPFPISGLRAPWKTP